MQITKTYVISLSEFSNFNTRNDGLADFVGYRSGDLRGRKTIKPATSGGFILEHTQLVQKLHTLPPAKKNAPSASIVRRAKTRQKPPDFIKNNAESCKFLQKYLSFYLPAEESRAAKSVADRT